MWIFIFICNGQIIMMRTNRMKRSAPYNRLPPPRVDNTDWMFDNPLLAAIAMLGGLLVVLAGYALIVYVVFLAAQAWL
jgi:hypothetical protein